MKKIIIILLALITSVLLIGCTDYYAVGRESGYNDGRETGYDEGRYSGYRDGQNTGYEAGRESGYNEGRETGYDEGRYSGYRDGQNTGYEAGRESGYNDGRETGYDEGRYSGYQSAGIRVTFVFNNEEDNLVILLQAGQRVREPIAPQLIFFDFLGWFTDSVSRDFFNINTWHLNAPNLANLNRFDFNTQIESNLRLYAWYEPEHSDLTRIINTLHGRPLNEVYNLNNQALVRNELDQIISQTSPSLAPGQRPLLVHNPFGTTPLSVFAAFSTTFGASVIRYTVITDGFQDFTRTINAEPRLFHEFMVMGFIEGENSTLRFEVIFNGSVVNTRYFEVMINYHNAVDNLVNNYAPNDNYQNLAAGLFVAFYHWGGSVLFFDNLGILRGIIFSEVSTNLRFDQDNNFILQISDRQIARVNPFGKVIFIYSSGPNDLSHDFDLTPCNSIIAIVRNYQSYGGRRQDQVIKMYQNYGTPMNRILIDFREFFPLHPNFSHNPSWLHMNSLQVLDNSLIISSRNANATMRLNNVFAGEIYIDWILSTCPALRLHDYNFLNPIACECCNTLPRPNTGQHTSAIRRVNGGYILTLFNNHNTISQTVQGMFDLDFNFENLNYSKMGIYSFHDVYFICDNTNSATLILSLEMPFSNIMASSQDLAGYVYNGISTNFVAWSNGGRVLREFSNTGDIIAEFSHVIAFYRVFKIYI